MNVSLINEWRLPGCGGGCIRYAHDPHAHEAYGLLLAVRTRPTRIVRTGSLTVDLDDVGRVRVDGQVVHLTGREWRLLTYLAERLGRFCSTDDIVTAVWGPAWLTPIKRRRADGHFERVDHRLVNVNVNRMRAKLGSAAVLITTVRHQDQLGRRLEYVEPTA